MAASGTRKLICTVLWSAAKPIMGGKNAPPTMAVTIRPDNSLVRSGRLSTANENASGKILAKPRPTDRKLATASVRSGSQRPSSPATDTAHVARKNFLGAIQFRIRSEEHTSELQSLRHLVCRL